MKMLYPIWLSGKPQKKNTIANAGVLSAKIEVIFSIY